MKKFIVILICSVLALSVNAQEFSREFGNVTPAEMLLDVSVTDKSAGAVVVHEIGRYLFIPSNAKTVQGVQTGDFASSGTSHQFQVYGNATFSSFNFQMDIHTKIKILTDEAGADFKIDIPFYNAGFGGDDFSFEGYTYNIEIVDDMQSLNRTGANVSTIQVKGDDYIKRITFPNAKAGSILEIKYRHKTNYRIMPPWQFQKEIPVMYSELTYRANPFFSYSFILRGGGKYHETKITQIAGEKNIGKMTYREEDYMFSMKNLPAYTDTLFVANPDDYRINLKFQLQSVREMERNTVEELMKTWPRISDLLIKDNMFGRYITAAEKEGKSIIGTLNLAGKSELEKIEAISAYIKTNYTWNGETGYLADKKLPALLKDRTGNAAGINLLMAGLMQAAGIETQPVALSTRENGKIYKAYPYVDFFDYVVLMKEVDGKPYFLDATEKFAAFDEVPDRIINTEGLLIRPSSEAWVTIPPKYHRQSSLEASVGIDPSAATVIVTAQQTFVGTSATELRSKTGQSWSMVNMLSSAGVSVSYPETGNMAETNKPVKVEYKYTMPISMNDGTISFNPFSPLAPKENIFTQPLRRYPVDLIYKSTDTYKIAINIPEGYTVSSLPESLRLDNAQGTFTYSASHEEGIIAISAAFTLKKAEYTALEYNALKRLYGQMVDKLAESIIIKAQ